MGNGNMMNILDNGIYLAQIMSPTEIETNLDLITYNGARCLNIQDRITSTSFLVDVFLNNNQSYSFLVVQIQKLSKYKKLYLCYDIDKTRSVYTVRVTISSKTEKGYLILDGHIENLGKNSYKIEKVANEYQEKVLLRQVCILIR